MTFQHTIVNGLRVAAEFHKRSARGAVPPDLKAQFAELAEDATLLAELIQKHGLSAAIDSSNETAPPASTSSASPLEEVRRHVESMSNVENVIMLALRSRAEMFEAGIKEAKRGAEAKRVSIPQPNEESGIELTPTPEGYRHIADVFVQEADDARKIGAYIADVGLRLFAQRCTPVRDNEEEILRDIEAHERHLATLDEDGDPLP